MSLSDIRKRLAALERATEVTRICVAFPPRPDSEFLGYSVQPLFVQGWHDHAENFEVLGDYPKECAARAHELANSRWLRDPLLTVALHPLTDPPTDRYPQ